MTFAHQSAPLTIRENPQFCLSISANSSSSSNVFGQKFTTSNFTEIPSDTLFGSSKSPANQPVVKKRKVDSSKSSGLSIDESIRYAIPSKCTQHLQLKKLSN